MNTWMRQLRTLGAQPDEAIRRMLGDEAFYLQLMQGFLEKHEINLLRERLDKGEYATAFVLAHSMKGSSVTLGLSPLSDELTELTELLRPFYEKGIDTKADAPGLAEAVNRHLTEAERYIEAFTYAVP